MTLKFPRYWTALLVTIVSGWVLFPTQGHAQYAAPTGFVSQSLVADFTSPMAIRLPDVRQREWWWLPAGGAVVGAVGFSAYYLSYCTTSDDGCMGLHAAPVGGAVLGAIAGGLLELGIRAGEAVLKNEAADPPTSRSEQLAGCYRMQIGVWAETGQHKGLVPPAEFRLDTVASTDRFAALEARNANVDVVRLALPEAGGARRVAGMWYPMGTDSLRVQWNTGFQMGGYRLAVRGDSVEGIATTWSDFKVITPETGPEGPVDPTAPVRGARIPCGG